MADKPAIPPTPGNPGGGVPPVPGKSGGGVPPVPGKKAGGGVPPVPGKTSGGGVPPVPGKTSGGGVPPVPGKSAGGVPPVPGKAGGGMPPVPGKSSGGVPPTPGKGAAPSAPADKKPAAAAPKPKPKAKVAVQTHWTPTELARRDWFLLTGWVVFAFSSLLATLFYVARYLFPNVTYEPPLQFKAGPPTEFAPGRVDERFKETNGTWIVRDDLGVYALSTVCTHLGCTPNWLEGEQKFKCPCHGSGFRKTGINFEGPAPRPLERYRIVQSDDGQVMVDKSQKFQFEKGEWEAPESFLYV